MSSYFDKVRDLLSCICLIYCFNLKTRKSDKLPFLNKTQERIKVQALYSPFESGTLTFHKSKTQSKIVLIDHMKKINLTCLSLFRRL